MAYCSAMPASTHCSQVPLGNTYTSACSMGNNQEDLEREAGPSLPPCTESKCIRMVKGENRSWKVTPHVNTSPRYGPQPPVSHHRAPANALQCLFQTASGTASSHFSLPWTRRFRAQLDIIFTAGVDQGALWAKGGTLMGHLLLSSAHRLSAAPTRHSGLLKVISLFGSSSRIFTGGC